MNGKYFASIIKEVADDLEESKYQHAEVSSFKDGDQEWSNDHILKIQLKLLSKKVPWATSLNVNSVAFIRLWPSILRIWGISELGRVK